MSLGWLSIGATGDISLTGLNVDSGTLYVDKINNRVGINTISPDSQFQINAPVDNVNTSNPLTGNTVSVISGTLTTPGNTTLGTTNLNSTLWINSNGFYANNTGSSIGLGGRTNDTGSGNRHTTLARISGVNSTTTTPQDDGEFVVETTLNGTMYERLRIKSDGKVGIGVSNPSGGLQVSTDIISQGATNTGYRKDVPQSYLTPGSSLFRVSNDVYSTLIAPTGAGVNWLGRIDSSTFDFKEVFSIAMNPANGDVYAVGIMTDDIDFYSTTSTTPSTTTFTTTGPAYPKGVFLAKYNQTGVFQWAAKMEAPSYSDYGTSVTVVGGLPVVTGAFENGTFTAYDRGTTGAAFATTIPSDGSGYTGFIVQYNASGSVQAVAKIDSPTGPVIPTAIRGYSTNGFYVAGFYQGSAIYAYNSALVMGPGVLGGGAGNNCFICYYNNSLTPQWLTIVDSSANDLTTFPGSGVAVGNALAVDQGTGDVYMTAYYNANITIRSQPATVFTTLTYNGAQSTFVAKWNNSGIAQWAARINSTLGTYQPSVAFGQDELSNKFVYVTGSFIGTVQFRNAGDSGTATTTQQLSPSSSSPTNQIVYLTQYNAANGDNLWSTKIQSTATDNAVGIGADSFGNAYVAFSTVITSVNQSVSTDIYQRNSFTAGGVFQASSNLYKHTLFSTFGSYSGVAVYNRDGKVVYTSRVDGNDHDYLTCIHIGQRSSGADRYPRIFLGGQTQGQVMSVYDCNNNIMYNLSGLLNIGNSVGPSTSNTAFVCQLASTSTYLMDPTSQVGTVKRFINSSSNRAVVVPYYDPDGNIETSYTSEFITIPINTMVEITFLGASWNALSNSPSYISLFNGNVGIGTATPSTVFQVDGSTSLNGNVGIGTKITGYSLHVNSYSPNNSYSTFINQTNPSSGGLYVLCSTTSASQKVFTVKTSSPVVTAIDVLGDGTLNIGSPTVNVSNSMTVNNLTVTGTFTASGGIPTGTVTMYAGVINLLTDLPAGWLLCDGSLKSSATYPALSALLGSIYGAAPSGSFRLPDLRNKFPFGKGSATAKSPYVPGGVNTGSYTQEGSTGGDQVHALTEAQLARHYHYCAIDRLGNAGTYNDKDYCMARAAVFSTGDAEWKYVLDNQQAPPNVGNADADGKFGADFNATNKVGQNEPHNNMPPYFVINFIIKT